MSGGRSRQGRQRTAGRDDVYTIPHYDNINCIRVSNYYENCNLQIVCSIFELWYRGFITSCKEDLSVKRHLAVTNVSNHWYLFTQWNMIKDLMTF